MHGRTGFMILSVLLGAYAVAACVPEGPPTGATSLQKTASAATTARASTTTSPAPGSARPVITSVWEDSFERAELGPDWKSLSPAWKINAGKLCARGARNKGVWLLRRLPVNARIEFDAVADASDGDLKVEVWGDGASGATASSYTNATSYIAILGGWKNTKHVLARLNEHGEDRQEINVDPHSDDERMRPVATGQAYHFQVERSDGKTLQISVNGISYFDLPDKDPLVGVGHEHVGFNNWDAPVCFDNLKVKPL